MLSGNLKVGVFRFALVPAQELVVPALNKGNMLRGGFGHAARRLCCVPQCTDTRACPLATTCPYKAVFEPSPPPGAERLSKNQDVPRPFVFRPPQTQQTRFAPGQPFEFGLVLIGRALDFLPYFVLSFRELAAAGLGLNRAKCTLQRVDHIMPSTNGASHSAHVAPPLRAAHSAVALGPLPGPAESAQLIYSADDQVFRPAANLTSDDWINARLRQLSVHVVPPFRAAPSSQPLPPTRCHPEPSPLDCHPERSEGSAVAVPEPNTASSVQRITINFLTPTFLRADGEVIRRPEFHHVFKRLRDRINALCTFFGDGPLDLDFRALGQRAEKVRTISSQIQWVDRTRTSSRTHQRHELSGFVGQSAYDFVAPALSTNGDGSGMDAVSEFLHWLALGELVHVGKHTAWGHGWMRLK